MTGLFTQTMEHKINNTFCSDCLQNLPEVIRRNTDLDYTYQQRDSGCFLKPTFHNMPYMNSFVPEIDVVVSRHEDYTLLHITGQPVKFVRIFMLLWFSFLLMMEVFRLILAAASILDSFIPDVISIAMCVFGYLLCKLATKATFHSVVQAILKEFL